MAFMILTVLLSTSKQDGNEWGEDSALAFSGPSLVAPRLASSFFRGGHIPKAQPVGFGSRAPAKSDNKVMGVATLPCAGFHSLGSLAPMFAEALCSLVPCDAAGWDGRHGWRWKMGGCRGGGGRCREPPPPQSPSTSTD